MLRYPVRTEKSRAEMICLVSRSARKDRPEPMRPSHASRYQTSRVHLTWSLSHGGVHETASRSPRYVGRDGEAATSFWYSSHPCTRATAAWASLLATVRRQAEVRRQRPIAPEGDSSISWASSAASPSKAGTSSSGYLSRS